MRRIIFTTNSERASDKALEVVNKLENTTLLQISEKAHDLKGHLEFFNQHVGEEVVWIIAVRHSAMVEGWSVRGDDIAIEFDEHFPTSGGTYEQAKGRLRQTLSEVNTLWKGARFEVTSMLSPKRRVYLNVPISLNDAGMPSTIHQQLGEIRRKADQRLVAFRKPGKTFFTDFPVEPIYEKVFSHTDHNVAFKDAQEWILEGAPAHVPRENVRLLTVDDIERFLKAFQTDQRRR